jgi:hypothetical protein
MRKGLGLLAVLLLIGMLAGCRVSPQAKQAAVRAASSAFFSSVLALESAAPTSQSTIKPAPEPDDQEEADVEEPEVPEPQTEAALGASPSLPVSRFHLVSLAGDTAETVPLVALQIEDATAPATLSGRSLVIRSTIDVEKIRKAVDARLGASSCPQDRALAARLSTALRTARIQLEMMQAVERADNRAANKSPRRLIVFASGCLVQDAAKALGTVGLVAR